MAACSGARLTGGNDAAYGARVIFIGTAVRRDDEFAGYITSSLGPYYWTFAVDAVERGEVGQRFTVASARSSASCGVEFELGQRYRVVAWGGSVPNRPEVAQGDADLLPQLEVSPRVEGEFGPPWPNVAFALAGDPFNWFAIAATSFLVIVLILSLRGRVRGAGRRQLH